MEKICWEEFKIRIKAKDMGNTIFIYAPFKNIIKNKKFDESANKKMDHLFLVLKRVILSIDRPPKFFVIVISDIKEGIDVIGMGFVPDIIKFEMGLISRGDFLKNRYYYNVSYNKKAIGDYEGKHVAFFDLDMGNFIVYLTLQKLRNAFFNQKLQSFYQIKKLYGYYFQKKMFLAFKIVPLKPCPFSSPQPMELIKKWLRYYLKLYEFKDLVEVKIIDLLRNTNRIYTLKALEEET